MFLSAEQILAFNRFKSENDLSDEALNILCVLNDLPHTSRGIDRSQIDAAANVSSHTRERIMPALLAKEWVTNHQDPGNRRRVVWAISPSGRDRLNQVLKPAEKA